MLSVSNLYTEYPNGSGGVVKAAQDISFTVPKGKLFTLLGPSGCGKTTTLRSIAGLERPTGGHIAIDDIVVFSSAGKTFVPPNKRDFGMVFQSYAIWPHMNVFENVAFPLKSGSRNFSKAETEKKVERVLKAVALDHLASREATRLSGGQQQRLALARALVMEPRLLLLDEPLSNLDAKLRELMRFELKRIQRDLDLTTIYVTHDQAEALALSHQIAVMHDGRIEQLGTPREIYERPSSRFVADFVGTTNFIEGTVLDAEGDSKARINSEIGQIVVDSDSAELARDKKVSISIRPENVHLSLNPGEREDGVMDFVGTVEGKAFLGEVIDYKIRVADGVLLARAHPSVQQVLGKPIHVRLPVDKCRLVEP
ncbi:ABC transporter ATP-binding protein [Pseudochelatococcus sp. B33]